MHEFNSSSQPSQPETGAGAIELVVIPAKPQKQLEALVLRTPDSKLVKGGIVGGLTLMGVGAALAVGVFQLAPSALSVAAYAVMAFSLVRLWPAIATGMVNLRTLEQAVITLTPVQTLEEEYQRFGHKVQWAERCLIAIRNELEVLNDVYLANKDDFSSQKEFQWEVRLKKQERQLVHLNEAVEQLRRGFSEVETLVGTAKAELEQLEGGTGFQPGKRRAEQSKRLKATLEQIRAIEEPASSSFQAAFQTYQQILKESL